MTIKPTSLPPSDVVVRALCELRDLATDRLAGLAGQKAYPDILADRRFLEAQRNGFAAALAAWERGLRPAFTAPDRVVIASESRPGLVYTVQRTGHVWRCARTCPQHAHFHMHGALIAGIERTWELLDQEDAAADLLDGAAFGRRLAAARARLEYA